MGNCIKGGKPRLREDEQVELCDKGWMKESGCIDKFSFSKNLNPVLYNKVQITLAQSSYSLNYNLEEEEDIPTLNSVFLITHKDIIKKGLPNVQISNFIFAMFKLRKTLFLDENSKHFNHEENERMRNISESYFGRNKVTSNFLNTLGIKSMNKILYSIREEFPNLQYCPILPRVVQFFLWYIPEKLTLKMTMTLLEENFKLENASNFIRFSKSTGIKYFSTNLKFTKNLEKIALTLSKQVSNKKTAKTVIEELIDNMCISVIPVEYLPIIFISFLLSGIYFIASLSGNLFSLIASDEKPDLEKLREACTKADILSIISKSHKFNETSISRVSSSDSNNLEACSTYVPMLKNPSKIFGSVEKKNMLFTLIPKVHIYGVMDKVFSFDKNGLLITELNILWHRKALASLILIETRKKVFGIFFDREIELFEKGVDQSYSLFFIHDRGNATFKHAEGEMVFFEFKEQSGIFIGKKEKPMINLEYSLLDVNVKHCEAFVCNGELIPDENLEVNNIELYLMK